MIQLVGFLFWLAMFCWACRGASVQPLAPLLQGMAMVGAGLMLAMSLAALVVRLA